MTSSDNTDPKHLEQVAVRKLSTGPKAWRFHLLIPASLLAGIGLCIGLPLLLLLWVESPALATWLQSWLRWAALPATVVTLSVYSASRRYMISRALQAQKPTLAERQPQ